MDESMVMRCLICKEDSSVPYSLSKTRNMFWFPGTYPRQLARVAPTAGNSSRQQQHHINNHLIFADNATASILGENKYQLIKIIECKCRKTLEII